MRRLLLITATCVSYALPARSDCRVKPVQRTVNSVRVTVDPKVELMSIAQDIGEFRARYPVLLTKEASNYRQDVEDAFGRYRNHRAVTLVSELSKQGFTFSRPPLIMLHLDDEFALRRDILPDPIAFKYSGGEEQVRELGREMLSFCKDIQFPAFYEGHRPHYEALVEQVARKLDSRNYIADIEPFYGVRQRSYSLVLVALYGTVGFGPSLQRRDGGWDVYNIMGPRLVADGVPDFTAGNTGSVNYFEYMQRHEFSHSFVNPLATMHKSEVDRLAPLFSRMPEVARKNMCGDWEECLNEQVVRAVTTFWAFNDSEEIGRQALANEQQRGAILLPELLAGIREYAAARNRYPTFESYYPVLLRRLESVAAK